MKIFYVFLLALLTSTFAFSQSPGYVIVRGHITSSNGGVLNNWPVNIRYDSTISPAGCVFSHTRYTNPNGYYADTIYCTTSLSVVLVSVKDCNNNYQTHVDSVPPLKVIEDNFTICTTLTIGCHAAFTASVSGRAAVFNSAASAGSTGTAITERFWSFGDGTSLSGNVIQPSHTYTAAGTYTVKLRITTTNNQCKDSVTQLVTIVNTPVSCQAYFIDSVIGTTVYSNSSYSTTGAGDSIVERHWTFGDNTAAVTGNVIAPTHTYNAGGSYMICLRINSAHGCSDSICKIVTISNIPTTCSASFVTSHQGNTYIFNSSASQTPAPDAIVRRKWQFGDGDTLGGNVITPTHTYTHSGSFTACLTIYTQNGCSKSVCQAVNIIDSSCHANFTYSATSASGVVTFLNASTSGAGTAITYTWNFGDSSVSTIANPVHTYPHSGVYMVCLTISTSGGCQSTECKQVSVGSSQVCHAQIGITSGSVTVGSPASFDSRNSSAAAPDTIYQRLWNFGDGTSLGGNVYVPAHTYATPGTYTVHLIIVSTGGCRDTADVIIVAAAVPVTCHAAFADSAFGTSVYYLSGSSYTNPGDAIVERRWTFGDSTAAVTGNVPNVFHQYAHNGTYTVCLRIVSSSGCRDSICRNIVVGNTTPVCTAYFTSNDSINAVKFNSGNSTVGSGATITTRYWSFGDSSFLSGNVVDPTHTYLHSGTYTVCLTIGSSNGCQNTVCHTVTVVAVPPVCAAIFKYVKLNATTLQFNSGSSIAPAGDSIISRKWTFGDGTTLMGNVVSPVKTYPASALYNACLRIQTALGCVSEACMTVRVGDSTVNNNDSGRKVEIISIYPNPATTQFTSVIWSRYSGISAELAIIDIYGVKKWSVRKTLLSGNNAIVIPTNTLLAGPYTFRVTTIYGIRSMRFYKL